MIKSEKGIVTLLGRDEDLMVDYIVLTKSLLNHFDMDFILTSIAIASKCKDMPADTLDLSPLASFLDELENGEGEE